MHTHIRLLRQTVQTQSDQLGPLLFAILSAYFDQYLYMLKLQCLIIAIFQVGGRRTLDHKVLGSILTWCRCIEALISVA